MLGRRPHTIGRVAAVAIAAIVSAGLLAPNAGAQESRGDTLPPADQILKKMVKAMGGEKVIRKHTHRMLTGMVEIPAQGISAELVAHSAAPNLRVSRVEGDMIGVFLRGYNGKIAWSDDPMQGAQIEDGDAAAQAVRESDFYAILNFKKNYKSIDVVGMAEHGDAECYELALTTKNDEGSALFINAETFRVSGRRTTRSSPQGEIEVISTIKEYKEYDGELIAVKTSDDIGGFMEQIVIFTDVSFETFDHDVFELPDSIKALLKDEGATTKPDN